MIVITGCVLTYLFVNQANEKRAFEEAINAQYVSTTMVVIDSSYSTEYKCSIENCMCATTVAPTTCDSNKNLQNPGECGNGPYCCQEIHDQCVNSDCLNGSGCKCQEQADFGGVDTSGNIYYKRVYNCNKRDCDKCRESITECNHRCIEYIPNQKCQLVCGDIYTISYSFVHFPQHQTNCTDFDCVMDYYKDPMYVYKGFDTYTCSIYNTNCMNTTQLVNGGVHAKYVNLALPSNLTDTNDPPQYEEKYTWHVWFWYGLCSFFGSIFGLYLTAMLPY